MNLGTVPSLLPEESNRFHTRTELCDEGGRDVGFTDAAEGVVLRPGLAPTWHRPRYAKAEWRHRRPFRHPFMAPF